MIDYLITNRISVTYLVKSALRTAGEYGLKKTD